MKEMQNPSMRRKREFLLLTAGALYANLTFPALAGVENPIELSDVPEYIIKDIRARFPESNLLSANTETEEDGTMIYEIQGRLKDSRKFEYDAFQEGEVEEIEIEFQVDMVPGAIMKAIQRKFPGFQPTYIEASHSRSMKVVKYEFVGRLGDKELDIEVSADGSRIEIADR